MLLRFVVKNLFSFKDQTEFNLFPNKTSRLPHHKVEVDGIDILRLSAVYGANGSGKSNLIKSIALLKKIIEDGEIENVIENKKFKLSPACINLPVEMGIEFHTQLKNYYYAISINNNQVVYEFLAQSKKEKDILIFERKIENEVQRINFSPEYYENDKNKQFASFLEEKILDKNRLLISLLSKKWEIEFPEIKKAFDWFNFKLSIISPKTSPAFLEHILDSKKEMADFANTLMKSFNTGIFKLGVDCKNAEDFFSETNSEDVKDMLLSLKNAPKNAGTINNRKTGEKFSLVTEGEELIAKQIYSEHIDEKGNYVKFLLSEESDGTKRLLDFLPALQSLVNKDKVYLIDEIERSIHPLTIKEIISKFSLDEEAKGQLIFTTHESCLLDQDILRPDEIWFCQKDLMGATQLYSLSDFKVHNTIDIEKGYLAGRYGGIPFLSNLHDLNWHKHAHAEQEQD